MAVVLKIAHPDWRMVVQCSCCCRLAFFSQVRLLVMNAKMLCHIKGVGIGNFHPIKLGCCTVPKLA